MINAYKSEVFTPENLCEVALKEHNMKLISNN
jgi:hypothetical protein